MSAYLSLANAQKRADELFKGKCKLKVILGRHVIFPPKSQTSSFHGTSWVEAIERIEKLFKPEARE
jgi:hypothetical protein